MKKLYIVKNQYDFDRIINKNNSIKNKSFIIYKENNNLPYSRFGISVGKKLGNAVYRNKMKRKIRAIIDHLRKYAKDNTYSELNKALEELLYKKERIKYEEKTK